MTQDPGAGVAVVGKTNAGAVARVRVLVLKEVVVEQGVVVQLIRNHLRLYIQRRTSADMAEAMEHTPHGSGTDRMGHLPMVHLHSATHQEWDHGPLLQVFVHPELHLVVPANLQVVGSHVVWGAVLIRRNFFGNAKYPLTSSLSGCPRSMLSEPSGIPFLRNPQYRDITRLLHIHRSVMDIVGVSCLILRYLQYFIISM